VAAMRADTGGSSSTAASSRLMEPPCKARPGPVWIHQS
jgi:hypothetical protein